MAEALAGQWVPSAATGSVLGSVRWPAATKGMRRGLLLLVAIAGFAVANPGPGVAAHDGLRSGARLRGGVSAGLVGALLAGYAARMVPESQEGLAIAIARPFWLSGTMRA
ncbi:hypothetical protein B1218_30255, partial [Pseudomonas ogarae]